MIALAGRSRTSTFRTRSGFGQFEGMVEIVPKPASYSLVHRLFMLAATLAYRGRKYLLVAIFLGGRHEKDEHDRSDSNWSGHTRRSAYFASSIPRKRLVTVRGQCLRRDRATPNTRQCCWRQSESASTGVSASLLRLPLLSVQSDSVVKRFCPEPVVLIESLHW